MTPLLRRWGVLCILAGISLLTFYNLDSLPSVYGRPGTPSRVAQITGKLQPGFQWKEVPEQYPVKSPMPLPTGAPKDLPRIQFKFKKETPSQKVTRERRKDEVKEVFVRSWNAYKKHAWLHDEVMPISGGSKDTFGGWGASLVDALDMLAIVGMEDEIRNATAELNKIDFNSSGQRDLNIFETTIRYLGGFLAAYDLTDGNYPILLDKAIDLGEMLYKAFDTPNRMPITRWDWLNTGQGGKQQAPYSCLVAEIASLSLEFTRLSQLSGDPKYYDAIQRISNVMAEQQDDTVIPGLWPIGVSPGEMDFTADVAFTLGGMADSAYEYLPKEHMMLGGLTDQYQEMYIKAFEASKKSLFFRAMNPENRDILVSGTARASGKRSIHLNPEAQHLTCFAGGMVGLGARLFDREADMKIAKQLTEGCIWAYEAMPTGIMPEIFHAVRCDDDSEEFPDCKWSDETFFRQLGNHAAFDPDDDLKEQAEEYLRESKLIPGMVKMTDRRYILRPEAIESVFYLYRMTGDTDYQDHAWRMFKAITKLTETKYSYAALSDVSDPKGFKYDSQESFWMAETLKYFYLIFSEPDLVSLDDYVFNTEAHPLRRPRKGQEDLWDIPEGRATR